MKYPKERADAHLYPETLILQIKEYNHLPRKLKKKNERRKRLKAHLKDFHKMGLYTNASAAKVFEV